MAMVAAYHLLWTAYGWWLPNDPRGSMSREVRCVDLESLGEIHIGRKRIQPAGKIIAEFYEAAKGVLKHPLLKFTQSEVSTLANSFAETIREQSYTCYACAIMPDHVHLLTRKHRDKAETMIEQFQDASREAILAKPQAGRTLDHPVWGGPGWKVYLNTREDIERVIRYIEQNPIKIRRPPQKWPFVKPYDGWLPGQIRRVQSAKRQAQNRRRR
jgi:REP element-mobilizing transposase RayT